MPKKKIGKFDLPPDIKTLKKLSIPELRKVAPGLQKLAKKEIERRKKKKG